jgi:hypothetical protein
VKRIFAILMACLFMMSVMMLMAAPAFAKLVPLCVKKNGDPCSAPIAEKIDTCSSCVDVLATPNDKLKPVKSFPR